MKQIIPLVIVIFLFATCIMKTVRFQPVIFKNDQLIVDTSLDSPQFRENITHVLTYYKETFTYKDGEVLISLTLWEDQNLMWNYTTKALDTNWLKKHP